VGGGVFALFCKPTDLSPDSWGKISFLQDPPPSFFPKVVPFKNPAGKKIRKNIEIM